MQITDLSEAQAILSKLIERVLKGEEVIIGKSGKPVAKLVPYYPETGPRQLGAGNWQGKIWMADDFDDLPIEFVQLITGEAREDESVA